MIDIRVCEECENEYDFYSFSVLLDTGREYRSMRRCSTCAIKDSHVKKIMVSTKERADPTIPDKSLRRVIKERK